MKHRLKSYELGSDLSRMTRQQNSDGSNPHEPAPQVGTTLDNNMKHHNEKAAR